MKGLDGADSVLPAVLASSELSVFCAGSASLLTVVDSMEAAASCGNGLAGGGRDNGGRVGGGRAGFGIAGGGSVSDMSGVVCGSTEDEKLRALAAGGSLSAVLPSTLSTSFTSMLKSLLRRRITDLRRPNLLPW